MSFNLSDEPIEPRPLRERLLNITAGAFVSFEGWVRNHHMGRNVVRLDYEAYGPLALKTGEEILQKMQKKYELCRAICVHRTGVLLPGDLAVWVGVTAPHRAEAFVACREIIDGIKANVPIWKHEYYADGSEEWVNPAQCKCAESHPFD